MLIGIELRSKNVYEKMCVCVHMGVSGCLCVAYIAYRLLQKTNSLHKALQFFCPACALPSTTCGIVQRDSHRLVAAQHAAWQLFRQLFGMALAGLTWCSSHHFKWFQMDRSSNVNPGLTYHERIAIGIVPPKASICLICGLKWIKMVPGTPPVKQC